MPNDVYFKVGLITIIGLSAKNAILIIEFAKDLRAEGKPLLEATIEAAHLRFRPIIMTSLAFTLGVVPLAIATGRKCRQPERHRHRRAGRHDLRNGAGDLLRAGLLRLRHEPVRRRQGEDAGGSHRRSTRTSRIETFINPGNGAVWRHFHSICSIFIPGPVET